MSTNFSATIDNFEGVIESNDDVELVADGNGGFRLTANGHNLSLLNVAKLVLRRVGVSSGAVNASLPGGEATFISSDRSPRAGDRAPEETVFNPVYQGKAAQELLPHEEAELISEAAEAPSETLPVDGTSSEVPPETPSQEA